MDQNHQPSSLRQNMDWLPGGGRMGELIRAMDWSKTPLGPVENWSQSLRTSISLCLSSTFPISIVWGPEMVQIYNDAYRPICGDAHPGSMGERFWTIWESARPAVGAVIERASSGTGSYIENQRMFLERKGYLEEAFMTFSFSPIRDEAGEVGGLFHPITETTERMLASRRAQTLRDLATRIANADSLEGLFQKAVMELGSYENDMPFVAFYSWNQARPHLLSFAGIAADEALGLKSYKWNEAEQKLISEGQLFTLKNPGERFQFQKAGPYPEVPLECLVIPLKVPGINEPLGFAVGGVSSRRELDSEYKDFFEKYQANIQAALGIIKALEQEQKRAEALAEIDRSKTAFFSNVSHELRTPLTLMLGPLEERFLSAQTNSEEKQDLDLIYRNGKRLLKLVNTILDFSRIEAGRLKSRFSPTSLVQTTQELASIFRSAIERAGLTLEMNASEFSEPIYIDREMWERIIINLISNAVKYTKNGSISLRFEESISSVSVEVQDTGIGIPKAELPRLFERFHRVEGAKGRTHEGTGIGLSLVQELVRLQGGTITVESEEGIGSRFRVTLLKGRKHIDPERILSDEPNYQSQAHPYLEEIESWLHGEDRYKNSILANQSPQTQHRAKVLVVDDNHDMRNYVANLLQRYWQIESARNGREALSALRQGSYDLVLTDVMMPEMNGFELLEEIRKDKLLAPLPVIMLSARAGEEAKVEGLSQGADDYLIKPFSARELVARVGAALRVAEIRSKNGEIQRERLRSAFAHSSIGMAFLSLNGHVIEANSHFSAITEYTIEELRGLHIAEFNHPDDLEHSLELWNQLLAGQISGFNVQKRLIRKDKSICWVENSLSPLFDESGRIESVIVVCQDVTSRKVAQDELILAHKKAEVANQAKSQFLANMSHEIRTPLAIIRGFSDLLQNPDIREDERQTWIQTIQKNSEHLAILIDDILDLSKVEANQIETKIEVFALSAFITDIESSFQIKAKEKNLRFTVTRDEKLPELIRTDSFRLRQILTNILGNAFKFTSEGHIHLQIGLSENADGPSLRFRILDSGVGMTSQQKNKLFQAFTQGDAGVTRSYGGTGLGLFISKKLSELLGGDLFLERSEAFEGSTFVLDLNLEKIQYSAPTQTMQSKKPLLNVRNNSHELAFARLLIVEDMPELRMLSKRMLEIFGARDIQFAEDGLEALELCKNQVFDLIFMDMEMPNLGGLETVKRLRENHYKGPIVALTAHAMNEFRDESLKAGFDAYMVKPFQKEELLDMCLRFIKPRQ